MRDISYDFQNNFCSTDTAYDAGVLAERALAEHRIFIDKNSPFAEEEKKGPRSSYRLAEQSSESAYELLLGAYSAVLIGDTGKMKIFENSYKKGLSKLAASLRYPNFNSSELGVQSVIDFVHKKAVIRTLEELTKQTGIKDTELLKKIQKKEKLKDEEIEPKNKQEILTNLSKSVDPEITVNDDTPMPWIVKIANQKNSENNIRITSNSGKG